MWQVFLYLANERHVSEPRVTRTGNRSRRWPVRRGASATAGRSVQWRDATERAPGRLR